MRRSVLAVAILLATAPVASATEAMPDVKPDLRAVEVAAPSVRTVVVVAPARAEVRTTETRTLVQRSTTTTVILVLAVIGAIAILASVL
jgi:hypothetical protein